MMCMAKNPIIPLINPKSMDGGPGKGGKENVSEKRRGWSVVEEIGKGSVWRRGVKGVGWSYQG